MTFVAANLPAHSPALSDVGGGFDFDDFGADNLGMQDGNGNGDEGANNDVDLAAEDDTSQNWFR